MELLIALGVLAVIGIPVAVIGLLIGHGKLRARIAALEGTVAHLTRDDTTGRKWADHGPWGTAAELKTPVTDEHGPLPAAQVAADTAVGEFPDGAAPDTQPDGLAPPSAERRSGAEASQDYPVVMRPDRIETLFTWLRTNWVYVLSAVSLALAGVFFVQYGIEKGLLSPRLRVLMSLAFGVALIVAGEAVRRRWGDGEASHTAYLPSTFSGAGLVSMFAGILAARQLYGLIGPEAAMVGLTAVAVGAVVLGWLHGPFLVAIGLVGATAAPFVVGGQSDSVSWLFGYFGVIALVGLAVDALRRWAWVSVLALALAYAAGLFLQFAAGGEVSAFALLLVGLVVMAIVVPPLKLVPAHDGPTVTEALMTRGQSGWPSFTVRLAGGAMLASCVLLLTRMPPDAGTSLLTFVLLTALVLAIAVWAFRAPALADLAALPAVAFLGRIVLEATSYGPLSRAYSDAAIVLRAPETAAPSTVTLLIVLATLGTLAAAVRSLGGPEQGTQGHEDSAHHAPAPRVVWAAGGCLFAPLAALLIELFWAPSAVIGAYPWALHVISLAAVMVILAERYARADGPDRHRAAYAVLSALSLVALALFLTLTAGALTLSLAVLVVVAAWLDRRFNLPEMAWYLQAAVLVLGWRLTIDPGIGWAFDSGWSEVILTFVGAIAGMAIALRLLKGLGRRGAEVFLESGVAAYAAILANVVTLRLIDERLQGDHIFSHWSLTLNAMPWLVVMLAQLYRMQLGGWMTYLRGAIAVVAGIIGFAGLIAAAIPGNPLLAFFGASSGSEVVGPMMVDTLLVAYGLPAVMLTLAALRMRHLPPWLRFVMNGAGVALAALYGGLEIRRFWRGDDLSVPGVTQPELYSYTVALLLTGALLLYQAIMHRSVTLRRAAMAVIALTIAKVFLFDASGLSGLTRVFSFLALGLSLAALAWLNRWAAARQGDAATDQPGTGAGG